MTDWRNTDEDKFKKYLKRVGKRLQKGRISLKREIKDVASALHIAPSRLERIEAGSYPNIQIGLFLSICTELKLDPYKTISSKGITTK